MKLKVKDFIEELSRWGIEAGYEYGRIVLSGGQEEARAYYLTMLAKSPEFEGSLIWELAQTNVDIMDSIEERRAIRWTECGDDSIREAIMCNILY